jgi:polyvinyl alcohol dehydrogenase (cytochrome)
VLVLALAGLIVSACAGSDSDGGGSAGRSDDTGETASPTGGAWEMLGADLANSRVAADETTIATDNVGALGPAWQVDGLRGVTGTPIVSDGTVYFGDWTGHVRALDAETGEEKWSTDIHTNYIGGALALDDTHVYAGTFEARIVALDRATGAQAWETSIGDHPKAVIFGSPVVTGGQVVVGVGSYEVFVGSENPSFRGHIVALDAASGTQNWSYYVTKGDASEGPGISIWSSPAVDLDRGVVYIGTGQAYAQPAPPRSDSLLALNLQTGEEVWNTQFTAGDAWTLSLPTGLDADVGAPPNLFQVDGEDAVGVGDKDGVYHALNRDTGELLWEHRLTEGGLQGGVMASAAVSDGRIFVTSNDASRNADFVALEADTGDEAWRIHVGAHVTGPVTFANGVVFVSDDSGRVAAYDAADGDRLWSFSVPAQAAGGIAVVDGTVYAGFGWWLSTPPADPKGGLVAFRLDAASAGGGAGGEGGGLANGPGSDDDTPGQLGARVYQQSCATCHGATGEGFNGPTLVGVADRLSREEHIDLVRNGKGEMPSWEGTLSDDEIEAVVDYERRELSAGPGG